MDSTFFQCTTIDEFCSLSTQIGGQPFSVLHVNFRSIWQRRGEFLAIVENAGCVLYGIVQTEINIHSELLSLFELNKYSSYSITRPVERDGGVLVYLRKDRLVVSLQPVFKRSELHLLKHCIGYACDYAFSRVQTSGTKCQCFFYRNSKASSTSVSVNSILCLVDDFNLDTLSASRPIVCDYLNTLAKCGIQKRKSTSVTNL